MKKILALTLALLMLFSTAVLTLTSCDEEEEKEKEKEVVTPVTSDDEGDIFAERAAVADGLGDYDFGGRKFRIVGHRSDEYFINEEDRNKGNLIADAKYARNKTVEDRFNVEIEVVQGCIY